MSINWTRPCQAPRVRAAVVWKPLLKPVLEPREQRPRNLNQATDFVSADRLHTGFRKFFPLPLTDLRLGGARGRELARGPCGVGRAGGG